ncbi:DinB family protein [Membranicola marinus]|uniref:DinB family protein n=1 Tax=Membranihabitans marinus TaxID=1227546 RepID=A0A953LBX5_9BACT|nr:DinB family protein [Membranihabitans marinus]MBY5957149.1 DinB family protein [Membranihabitans marinus]
MLHRMKGLIVVVLLFTCSGLYGQSYLAEIKEKWSHSAQYFQDIAALMPDSLYDFKPTPKSMTFGEQLVHAAQNMINLSRNQLAFTNQEIPEKPLDQASPSVVRHFLKSAFDYASQAIGEETEETLNRTTKFFAGPKTHRQIINLMHDHATHHRGQLIVYLRLNAIAPPKYVGW